jgi:hypothetical protein
MELILYKKAGYIETDNTVEDITVEKMVMSKC